MDENHLHSITGGHITADMLLAYRKGTLPDRERLRIERAMADDPFLQDAVEGLQEADPDTIEQVLSALNRDIDVITGQRKPFRLSATVKKYASAAMILAFFGLTLLIMNRLNKDAAQQQLAMEDKSDYPAFSNADTTGMGSGTAKADSFTAPVDRNAAVHKENNMRIGEAEVVTGVVSEDLTTPDKQIESVADDAGYAVIQDEMQPAVQESKTVKAVDSDTETFSKSQTNTGVLSEVTVVEKERSKDKRKKEVADKTDSKKSIPAHVSGNDAEEYTVITADSVYAYPQVMPEYPGGTVAMMEFFTKHLRFPAGTPEGTIYVEFAVQTDGSITGATIKKGLSAEADAEALRVVNLMPKWSPGTVNGKPVITLMLVPVKHEQN